MTALVAQAALAAALAQSPSVPPLAIAISRSTRLLVIAPHPDDGVLGAAGLIRRVVSRGGRVRVVWATSGDGFPKGVASAEGIPFGTRLTSRDYQSYGTIREHEARAALAALGVRAASLTFLGFPDDGLCQLASTSLAIDAPPFTSPYTSRASPPLTEQIIRGVQYRGLDLRREFEHVIADFRPTLIVAPHPSDEHPDHCSTHVFLRGAIDELAGQGWTRPHVLHYLIHYRGWPPSEDADGSDRTPLDGFPPAASRWVRVALTPDELGAKRAALLAFHSQLLVIERFVLAFARSNELFLEGEPASLPKCWCNGENVATETLRPQKPKRPSGP
jgi:LmbE family N-acetylglucosaminyl deacetylase